jgi:hypothetical protein
MAITKSPNHLKDRRLPESLLPQVRTTHPGSEAKVFAPVQLGLFWEVLAHARLSVIDHPRPVFYQIWMETQVGCGFRVRKKSGIGGRVLDKRIWPFDTLEEATKFYDTKIREKTNLQRKSPRKYRIDKQWQPTKS